MSNIMSKIFKRDESVLTKCVGEMAGYWPRSFFYVHTKTDTESRSMNSHAERTRSMFSHLNRSLSDLLYDFRANFSCGTQQVVPSGQDNAICLAFFVAKHSSAEFGSLIWPS